jgi:phosphatidylserine/phosphatidylglycerophosphate/cardiolipin synthase-like enzyme
VDHKSNIVEDKSGKARAALSTLSNAGVDVRTIEVYPIAHDKVIVVDGRTVELGSFNYSAAAQTRNSENVLVNWDNPALARVYEAHFERNWAQGRTFSPRY